MRILSDETSINKILENLTHVNTNLKKIYKGESSARQPVHTVYGGAHLFECDTAKKIGEIALQSFYEYASNGSELAKVLGLNGEDFLLEKVYNKIVEKLKTEAVEDFRIDFEDGFGNRSEDEEDAAAENAANEVFTGIKQNTLPPFLGIRIKTFSEELKRRGIRTLDIFISTLIDRTNGELPDNFVVTLPKVTTAEHVSALVEVFQILETKLSLASETLKMEIMVETTQSIFDSQGRANLIALFKAAKGRCKAAHFGVYDYTASCEITASLQTMDHPACDFARNMMKVCLAGTGVWLSDGATNIMPIGPHKGPAITDDQKKKNAHIVHRAWKIQYDHIQNSLSNAFYQGWDLHPAQLPIRYAAVYIFFLNGLEQASVRLKNFIEKAAQATLVGDVFDDAATGQGLLNYFLRALNCGAISEQEILATGLTIEEVREKSFLKILEKRKEKSV